MIRMVFCVFAFLSVFLAALANETWPTIFASSSVAAVSAQEDSPVAASRIEESLPSTIAEARTRARLLHETLHGSLQIIHRDFFQEEDRSRIPSRSLEEVFSEISDRYGVELRWIAVDLKAMSVANEPQSEFEIEAARALKSGDEEFESFTEQQYRFAGRIRLSATCLSCHASQRSSNADRSAGLVITMPLK